MSAQVKKMKQGMSYSCKEKTIIMNVFKYFKNELSGHCVTEIVRRTAKATGCSEKSIFQFRKEEASVEGFREPLKTKVRKGININSRDMKYDKSVRDAIRTTIYGLKYKNILPSLNTILKTVNENNQLPNFSLMTLRRLMFDMGFYYEKNGNKSTLTEKGIKLETKLITTKTKASEKKCQKQSPLPSPSQVPSISNENLNNTNIPTYPVNNTASHISNMQPKPHVSYNNINIPPNNHNRHSIEMENHRLAQHNGHVMHPMHPEHPPPHPHLTPMNPMILNYRRPHNHIPYVPQPPRNFEPNMSRDEYIIGM